MGLDVVRRRVRSLNGQIDVRSEKGKGTVISLRIPLASVIDPKVDNRESEVACSSTEGLS